MNLHSKDFLKFGACPASGKCRPSVFPSVSFLTQEERQQHPFPFPLFYCVFCCAPYNLRETRIPRPAAEHHYIPFEPTPCYELGTSFYDLPRSLFSLLISFQCQRELPTLLALCFSDWVENLPLKHNTCNIRGATFVSFRNISCFFNLYNCTSGDYEKKNTEKILLFLTHLLSAPHFL